MCTRGRCKVRELFGHRHLRDFPKPRADTRLPFEVFFFRRCRSGGGNGAAGSGKAFSFTVSLNIGFGDVLKELIDKLAGKLVHRCGRCGAVKQVA